MDDREKYLRWLEEMWSVHKFDPRGCAEREERDTMLESYARMTNEALEDPTPEERHRLYKLLRLNVYSRPDEPLVNQWRIRGDRSRSRDTGLSSCELSSLSVRDDKSGLRVPRPANRRQGRSNLVPGMKARACEYEVHAQASEPLLLCYT